ncbi:lipase member I-like [Centroberyx gerrardi]|uniref:lipase member I-like n=1 Tax=Centroberyx gerrardi TaxID=166262 RepID=UPI003AAA74E0
MNTNTDWTTSDLVHCGDFLSSSPASPQLQLLRFSGESGPCGSPFEVTPNLSGSLWDPDNPTVVIVPGRRPPAAPPGWVGIMARELLLLEGRRNVLAADWLLPPEQEIADGAGQIGERLGQSIRALLERGSSAEMFHLIGFGVGAHVAGSAGRSLHGAIGRITGLDPFAPVFSETDKQVSLNYTDAQYVDVVHTNFNANEPVAALGFSRPVGHVDFYIGSGHEHPGCPQALMHSEQYLLCSHRRAFQLFTSSIQAACKLTALPCESVSDFEKTLCTHCHLPGLSVCPQLGYDISWLPPNRPVRFKQVTAVLDISATAPYCVSPFLLEIHLEGNTSLQAQLFIQLKGDLNKTSIMLVSGPSMVDFQPHKVYRFLISVDHVEDFKTMSLKFYSERLLYFQWMKRRIKISYMLLTQLPTHAGNVYWRRSVSAVENQVIQVDLQTSKGTHLLKKSKL